MAMPMPATVTTGTTGVLGQPWRADVTAHGSIHPWDGAPALDWYVAADDRWHRPAEEVAVRQVRLLGAPVFETRLRVPGGDAVQRIWSVPDSGGLTLVEVMNDSPLPIACALTRDDLLTTRPPSGVPVQGIELPPTTIVLPIGHRASITVALAHDGAAAGGRLPWPLPPPDAVARGWVAVAERASRLDVPDAPAAEAVVAARAELVLAGPADAAVDPEGHLLGLAELVRMGELGRHDLDPLVPEVAGSVELMARREGWAVDAALDAAAVVLAAAGERRAVEDVARIVEARSAAATPPTVAEGVRAVAALERRLLRRGRLLPDGVPAGWEGVAVEAHGLAAGPSTTLSFALRWHGANPAVLWEVEGEPIPLSAPAVDPGWQTGQPKGEALWRVGAARRA